MKIKNKKTISIIIAIGIVLVSIGTVGALNGWFGGGDKIPSDTMTRGLVGYWSFDEGSGQYAYDSSENLNTGTLGSDNTINVDDPEWTTGKVGGALKFDGKNDYVNAGDVDIANHLSVEAWVKTSVTGENQAIIVKGSGTSNEVNYYLVIRDNNYLQGRVGGGADYANTDYLGGTDGEWHHVVMTYDRQYLRLYFDGEEKDTDDYTNAPHQADLDTYIGSWIGVSSYKFAGTIDDVRLYDRALSAEEIRYHYNRGGPVAHWTFDEGNGTTTYDMTDNDNDGTFMTTTTSPTWTTGKYGTALSFDGIDDYVNCGDNITVGDGTTNSFTIEAWSQRIGTNVQQGSIIATGGSGWAKGYLLQHRNDGFWAEISDGSDAGVYIKAENIGLDNRRWHHLVLVVDKSENYAYGYADGVLVVGPVDISSEGDLYNNGDNTIIGNLGDNSASDQFFDGLIDEIRIYNYTRTPDEIALDYNAGFAARFGLQGLCKDNPGSCMDYGLVGYWDFEEGEGTTTYDGSDNSNDGQFQTAASSPKWTTGVKPLSGGVSGGSALEFDGKDDYVDCGNDSSLNVLNAITVEGWVKSIGPPSDDYTSLFGKETFWYIHTDTIENYNTHFFQVKIQGDTNYTYTTGYDVGDNNWHHYVGTYDSGNGKLSLYVDGILKATGATTTGQQLADSSSRNMVVSSIDSRYTNSLIDEVRIYNRALSVEEIRYHYNRGGPVAHWKFDEGNGTTTYDSSNNSNDGTFMTTTTSPTWTTGKYGTALEFDGVDDYVLRTTADWRSDDQQGTIEMWFKVNRNVADQALFASGDEASNSRVLWMGTKDTGVLRIYQADDDTGDDIYGTTNIIDDTWHHVVFRSDGTSYAMYLDGKSESITVIGGTDTGDWLTDTNNRDNFTIGAWKRLSGLTSHFTGLIDDVRVYNYVRTPSQIQQDYNQGMSVHFGPVGEGIPEKDCSNNPAGCMDYGLVGYWNFEEGGGTYAYDNSDYTNDGILGDTDVNCTPKWTTGIKTLSGGISSGSALDFGGHTWVRFGADSSLAPTTAMSVEMWLNINDLAETSSFIDKFGGGDGYKFSPSNDEIKFELCSSGCSAFTTSSFNLVADTWYHIVLSWDGTTAIAYKNGIADSTTLSFSSPIGVTGQQLAIGAGNDACGIGSFNGSIDEARIYNRALSIEEIRYHYNRGGPVAHWKFDEGNGTTTYDGTPNDNDGTFMTSDTSPSWVEGKYGSALSFDGTDDYVDTDLNVITTSAFSIEGWAEKGTMGTIISQRAAAAQFNFLIRKNGVNTISVYRPTSATWISASVTANAFFHFALIYNGTNLAFYVDGILIDSVVETNGYQSNAKTRIGVDAAASSNPFNGLIDDVRIYNYARTHEQIMQDYNSGLSTHFK